MEALQKSKCGVAANEIVGTEAVKVKLCMKLTWPANEQGNFRKLGSAATLISCI